MTYIVSLNNLYISSLGLSNFVSLGEKLNGLSPLKKLNQGYSFVADADGRAVTSIENIKESDEVTIHVTDGEIKALVKEMKGIIRV